MPVDPPKETFVLEVKWHFNKQEEREAFRNWLMSQENENNPVPTPLSMKFRSFFSHCSLCGRPQWLVNLINDECGPAFYKSCQRWQERGGYEPPAGNNV